VRPFGLCTLIVGFNAQDLSNPASLPSPVIYLTEPSGVHSEWKANAIGRGAKPVREFLEKAFVEALDREETVKLAIRSLLEVVQTGAANIEIAVMEPPAASTATAAATTTTTTAHKPTVRHLSTAQIQAIIEAVEKEKAEEAEKRRAGTSAAQST
jgi:20S proteasome subunit alpha 4